MRSVGLWLNINPIVNAYGILLWRVDVMDSVQCNVDWMSGFVGWGDGGDKAKLDSASSTRYMITICPKTGPGLNQTTSKQFIQYGSW